jgi:hypothetical protein
MDAALIGALIGVGGLMTGFLFFYGYDLCKKGKCKRRNSDQLVETTNPLIPLLPRQHSKVRQIFPPGIPKFGKN